MPSRSITRRDGAFPGTVKGYDLLKLKHVEAESEHGLGCFRLTPVLRAQPPCNFHARGEVSCERRDREANEPRERRYIADLHGPKAEAVLIKVGIDTRDHDVAVLAGQRPRQILADMRVGIHGCEWCPVSGQPSPKLQAIGSKFAGHYLVESKLVEGDKRI